MEIEFDALPKYLKEEIWKNLDEKEIYKMRMVSNEWKNNIENPKTKEMKEKFKNASETKEKWKHGSKFYRGYFLTSKILDTILEINVGLECCYGRVLECRWGKKNDFFFLFFFFANHFKFLNFFFFFTVNCIWDLLVLF